MNKKIFYAILLVSILGAVLYYQMQTWESKLEENPYYFKETVLKNSDYLAGFFFEKYYNEKQPANPFVRLDAGSHFLFHFSSQDSTLFYHIIEDSPANMASVKVEAYEFNIKIKDDRKYGLLIDAQGLREVVGKGKIKILSKQGLTHTAHSCDQKMASIVSKLKTNTYTIDWRYSPSGGLIMLLVLSLFIWFLRWVSGSISRYFKLSEYSVFLVVIIGVTLFTTWTVSLNLIRKASSFDSMWDVVFSVYGWFNILTVVVFILFRYLIRKLKSEWDYWDLEFGKYLFIVFAWILLCTSQIYVLSYCYESDYRMMKVDTDFVGFLLGAVIFATANFLNNFRAHYFDLRRKGKSLKMAETKQETSQSELSALQSRVNSHFLYNSLNSIAALADTDSPKTKEMALALSDFYKYSTNRQEEIWTTIPKEIEMIKKYLEIEKIRFGDKLNFKIFCNDNVSGIKIPKFLIQPLVENAIKYGYDVKDDQINVIISTILDKRGKQVTIAVQDSGLDFPEDMDMGHGIRSIQKKLNLTYPESHYLSFSNKRRTMTQPRDRELYEKHTGQKLVEPEMKIACIILYKPKKDD